MPRNNHAAGQTPGRRHDRRHEPADLRIRIGYAHGFVRFRGRGQPGEFSEIHPPVLDMFPGANLNLRVLARRLDKQEGDVLVVDPVFGDAEDRSRNDFKAGFLARFADEGFNEVLPRIGFPPGNSHR